MEILKLTPDKISSLKRFVDFVWILTGGIIVALFIIPLTLTILSRTIFSVYRYDLEEHIFEYIKDSYFGAHLLTVFYCVGIGLIILHVLAIIASALAKDRQGIFAAPLFIGAVIIVALLVLSLTI